MKQRLLIIDDDHVFCGMLTRHFGKEYAVTGLSDPEEALKYIAERQADVVLTDLSMPKVDGMEILKAVKAESPDTDVIMMTAYAKVETAVEAMKKGAYDYIVKPFTTEELSLHLKNLFLKRRLLEENINLRKVIDTKYRPENIIGESQEMQEVYRFIERVSMTDATALITGESGTGKELVARALHFSGSRKDRHFVSINCTAMPETLIESELFGYVKGAFTGAGSEKRGLFEYASSGTIFLDEIADTPLSVQAKLLRVLQDHSIRQVGGDKEIPVDVRVVCATNRDLGALIRENKFREDLYYRINVVSIHLPPLRTRKGDIPFLIGSFLQNRKKIHPKCVTILSHYDYPGNVRELKNIIERLVTLTDAETIMPDDLPHEVLRKVYILEDAGSPYNEAKRKVLDEFNRAVITGSLLKYDGNVSKAAGELRLDRANFQRLMRRYHISSREFRENSQQDNQA